MVTSKKGKISFLCCRAKKDPQEFQQSKRPRNQRVKSLMGFSKERQDALLRKECALLRAAEATARNLEVLARATSDETKEQASTLHKLQDKNIDHLPESCLQGKVLLCHRV